VLDAAIICVRYGRDGYMVKLNLKSEKINDENKENFFT